MEKTILLRKLQVTRIREQFSIHLLIPQALVQLLILSMPSTLQYAWHIVIYELDTT